MTGGGDQGRRRTVCLPSSVLKVSVNVVVIFVAPYGTTFFTISNFKVAPKEMDDWNACDAEAVVAALSVRYRFSRANAVQLLRDEGILPQRDEEVEDELEDRTRETRR